jgi:hypothetical protein
MSRVHETNATMVDRVEVISSSHIERKRAERYDERAKFSVFLEQAHHHPILFQSKQALCMKFTLKPHTSQISEYSAK